MKKTKMSRKTRHLSRQQLVDAARMRQECNAKACKVVESLLERRNDREQFISKLKDINQSHLDDIVEERAILQLCGYPLCEHDLENIPAKTYKISTTTNQVYDITDRKKFCSKQCFKASQYVKSQLLTSPLWMRNQETIPKFKLLEEPSTTLNHTR